jgi:hypothetical protein
MYPFFFVSLFFFFGHMCVCLFPYLYNLLYVGGETPNMKTERQTEEDREED